MNRRDFLASSMAATGVAGLQAGGSMPQTQQSLQACYELRRYELRVGPMTDRMHEYLKDVSVPAHNRAGVRTIGAFTPVYGGLSPAIYLLLPYPSIQEFATLGARLDADAAFRKAADAHAALPATDPAYLRIHSQLMIAATSERPTARSPSRCCLRCWPRIPIDWPGSTARLACSPR